MTEGKKKKSKPASCEVQQEESSESAVIDLELEDVIHKQELLHHILQEVIEREKSYLQNSKLQLLDKHSKVQEKELKLNIKEAELKNMESELLEKQRDILAREETLKQKEKNILDKEYNSKGFVTLVGRPEAMKQCFAFLQRFASQIIGQEVRNCRIQGNQITLNFAIETLSNTWVDGNWGCGSSKVTHESRVQDIQEPIVEFDLQQTNESKTLEMLERKGELGIQQTTQSRVGEMQGPHEKIGSKQITQIKLLDHEEVTGQAKADCAIENVYQGQVLPVSKSLCTDVGGQGYSLANFRSWVQEIVPHYNEEISTLQRDFKSAQELRSVQQSRAECLQENMTNYIKAVNILAEGHYEEKNEAFVKDLQELLPDQTKLHDDLLDTIFSASKIDERIVDILKGATLVSAGIQEIDSTEKVMELRERYNIDLHQFQQFIAKAMKMYFNELREYLDILEDWRQKTECSLKGMEDTEPRFEGLLQKCIGLTRDEASLLPNKLSNIIFRLNRMFESKEQLLSYAVAKARKCQKALRRGEDKNVVLKRTAEDIDGYEGQKSVEDLVKRFGETPANKKPQNNNKKKQKKKRF